MQWEELRRGAEYYTNKYSHWVYQYQSLRERGSEYWLHLERLDAGRIRNEIIGSFLNRWLCRVNYESARTLKEVLNKLPPLYLALCDESIEDVDFKQRKRVDGRLLTIEDIITRIMGYFLSVRPKFGPVPASKLMHMALSSLFVMWDTPIREAYGIPTYHQAPHARWYVSFLKLMQIQANHAISNVMEIYGVDREEAIQHITKTITEDIRGKLKMRECPELTLARILDMYNFAIRDVKLPICERCISLWCKQRMDIWLCY